MSLFISLAAALLLTLALPGAQTQQCSGDTRCANSSMIPPSQDGQNMTWFSRIRLMKADSPIDSLRLRWMADARVPINQRYAIVYRELPPRGSNAQPPEYKSLMRPPRPISPSQADTMFMLRRLAPGTMYEVMICRPGFDTSNIRPPRMPNRLTPFIEDCGSCTACYSTEEIFYDFDTTTVSRVNSTHVRLVCDITSNVAGFAINWSISDPVDENERMMLDNGDVIDDLPVFIADERQGSGGFMSVLVAPEGVLDRDIQCIANSNFGRQSSESGAFQLIEDEPQSTEDFPMWAIIIVAVVCLLVLICMIVAAALIVGLVCSCSRTRKRMFEPTDIHRKISESNEYLDAKLGLQKKIPLEEMTYNGKDKGADLEKNILSEGSLRELLMNDKIIIDSSLLQVTTIIGQGEYGVVYKGLLRKGTMDEVVAVKSLKGIFATESDVQSAVQEIVKMKEFTHTNVMSLIGVSTGTSMSGGAPLIIMPYMARGSLLSYLRKERKQLLLGANTDLTQVGAVQKLMMQMCLQISRGMAYLASLRFIHRDLAARNCMIDEKGVIKVSDFGLAEDIYMRNYFRQSSQDSPIKLPLKWMSPESIKLGIFSEKSDVWSYGVTCWEIFTGGEIPYQGIHARDVIQFLEDGKHLPRPKNQACSDNMFAVMRSCWLYSADDRPDFAHLSSQIDSQLTALADYVDLSMFGGEGAATQED